MVDVALAALLAGAVGHGVGYDGPLHGHAHGAHHGEQYVVLFLGPGLGARFALGTARSVGLGGLGRHGVDAALIGHIDILRQHVQVVVQME
eukprot:9661072-Ditylum_brightwellii.AAC.1